ncbi:cell wall protein, partial [Streptomyces sp. NPDC057456]
MEEFFLPDDITALSDDELDNLLDGAVKAFDAKAGSSTVTTDDLTQLREQATAVENIRTEKAERIEAAQKAAAEIEALAATVRGDDGQEAATGEQPAAEPAAEPAVEPEPAKETVTASAQVKGRALA